MCEELLDPIVLDENWPVVLFTAGFSPRIAAEVGGIQPAVFGILANCGHSC